MLHNFYFSFKMFKNQTRTLKSETESGASAVGIQENSWKKFSKWTFEISATFSRGYGKRSLLGSLIAKLLFTICIWIPCTPTVFILPNARNATKRHLCSLFSQLGKHALIYEPFWSPIFLHVSRDVNRWRWHCFSLAKLPQYICTSNIPRIKSQDPFHLCKVNKKNREMI